MVKIAIGIPLRGRVSINWALNFANIVKYTVYETDVLVSKHYLLTTARENIVNEAKRMGATHLLFWDSDIIPRLWDKDKKAFLPYNHFINDMVNLRYPVVSGVYMTKRGNLSIYRYTGDERVPYVPHELKLEDVLNNDLYVDATALGFMLIDMRVFYTLEKFGFKELFTYNKKRIDWKTELEVSEDIHFCDLLRRCGFAILVVGRIACIHETPCDLYPTGEMIYNTLGED